MKKRIWHFYYSKRFSFYPPDYHTIGLGGSEAVLVLLTKYLAEQEQEVHVFNSCFKPGIYDNVHWHLQSELEFHSPPDIFVAVRFEDSIKPDHYGKENVFWMLDNRTSGAVRFNSLNVPNSKIVVASDAMSYLLTDANIPLSKIIKIFHPIECNNKNTISQFYRKPICLYSSMPTRGLDVVLDCWPEIKATVKNAELWITNGYVPWGYTTEEALDKYSPFLKRIKEMEKNNLSVKYIGVLAKNDFHSILNQASILFYPTKFPEMFCLIAAECSINGIPIIASNIFALKERVKDGITGYLIDGDIDSHETKEKFISKAILVLKDDILREQIGNNSKLFAEYLKGHYIAKQWVSLFNQ